MVSGAHDHGEGLGVGEAALTAARAHFDAIGAGRAEDPVAVHVRRFGRVDETVALTRVEVDLGARTEGASLEEGDARALGCLREVQRQVGAIGQCRVVDALGGQAGPHDVAVLSLRQHVGGCSHRAEHVVARVGQGRGAHEARVGGHRKGRGADGTQHGGACVGQRVVLDSQTVGEATLAAGLSEAHVQVPPRDLHGIAQQGQGRVRSCVVSTVIGSGSRRGRRIRGRFRLFGGGDAVAHCEHRGEADVGADGHVGGISDGHDSVREGVGSQGDAHVHGVGLAHAEVLLLRIHTARAERAFHGTPGTEIVLGLEELNLVGGAQGRIVRAHGGRVLIGRAGDEVVGDVDAARGDRQVVGVPYGSRVRVGGAEDRVGGADGDGLSVLLGVLNGLGDPARRGGVAGDVDRLDGRSIGAEQLGDASAAALDADLSQEVAVDGDPRAPRVGGDTRVERDVGQVVVAGVLTLGVVGQGERRGSRVAVGALRTRRVVRGFNVLDGAVGGVCAADLPDQRRDRRGVDSGAVGTARGHLVVRDVTTRLREGRVQVRVARVVDAAVRGVVAGEEAVDAVAVVDEHFHAARAVDADEVERVGLALKLVGVSDFAGAEARPDGRVTGAGVLGRGVQDGALGSKEGQVGTLCRDDELRLRLVFLAGAGPRLGDPQRGFLHRHVDGVQREAVGVVMPDGDGCIDMLSGDDPFLVLVGSSPRGGGRECQEEGERSGADASQM